MKNFGFSGQDNVVYVGTNGKMSEISAAMGLTGLESLDQFIAANRRNYATYRAELQNLPGLQVITYNEVERGNYQYVVVEIDEVAAGISRDDLMRVLRAENVLARRYFHPGCHRMEPYQSLFPHARLHVPETERLTQRVMSLPTGTAVGQKEIEVVCAIIRLAVTNSRELRPRLSALLEQRQP
jgi:dTDP-4-amino-4,6-dideoxygalactose transaminase